MTWLNSASHCLFVLTVRTLCIAGTTVELTLLLLLIKTEVKPPKTHPVAFCLRDDDAHVLGREQDLIGRQTRRQQEGFRMTD